MTMMELALELTRILCTGEMALLMMDGPRLISGMSRLFTPLHKRNIQILMHI